MATTRHDINAGLAGRLRDAADTVQALDRIGLAVAPNGVDPFATPPRIAVVPTAGIGNRLSWDYAGQSGGFEGFTQHYVARFGDWLITCAIQGRPLLQRAA